MRFLFSVMICVGFLLGSHSFADEESTGTPETKSDTKTEQTTETKKRTKGKRVREKETEGTQAPERFQADTVIKSKYRVNGESLEVDPD